MIQEMIHTIEAEGSFILFQVWFIAKHTHVNLWSSDGTGLCGGRNVTITLIVLKWYNNDFLRK